MSSTTRIALLLSLCAGCSSSPSAPGESTLPDLVVSAVSVTTAAASLASQGPLGLC